MLMTRAAEGWVAEPSLNQVATPTKATLMQLGQHMCRYLSSNVHSCSISCKKNPNNVFPVYNVIVSKLLFL